MPITTKTTWHNVYASKYASNIRWNPISERGYGSRSQADIVARRYLAGNYNQPVRVAVIRVRMKDNG